jgi:hypothetical protein
MSTNATSKAAVVPICRYCGSTEIVRDASARWDVAAQDWRLSGVFDCTFCDECNGESDTLAKWTEASRPDTGPLVTLRFRPQAWVRDHAISVDPEAPDTWQVAQALLLERFPTSDDWSARDNDRDDMRLEGNAPAWIREWSGPFEIDLAEAGNPWGGAE